jgi:hypothetical protein
MQEVPFSCVKYSRFIRLLSDNFAYFERLS